MNIYKTAVVVDSGCDLPEEYCKRENVFVIPFRIIYENEEFIDGVNIKPSEIYQRLASEIPKTSLPSGQDIVETFDKIKALGFENAVVVTVSSKLSGTCNMLRLIAKDVQGLNIEVIDTKNIGIGAGFFGIDAIEQVENGMPFNDIVKRLNAQTTQAKVFFSLGTLEYLHKGGRIGLVSSLLGSALKIKPVISCNEEGVYYIVSKSRGRKQSIQKMIELAEETVKNHSKYMVAISYGALTADYQLFKDKLAETVFAAKEKLEVELGAALGIHTGPEMFGIGVYIYPDA